MRYFVLRSRNAASTVLARLDEDEVEVSMLGADAWRLANDLLFEIVSDPSWEEINRDIAAHVARELDLSLTQD